MTDGSGVFVVFEGGDSVGKSTQVRMLAEWLRHEHVEHLVTHEPGDTWLGQQVRRLVLDVDSGSISPRTEALLYAADKAQHVDEVVIPALERGLVVISDRYVDSTLAYQGAGRVLAIDEVEAVARWATHDLRPDLTILLDAAPDQAVSQLAQKDRLEREGEDFHSRVRGYFLDLAARDPEHYLVLDARDTRESLARAIRHRVDELRGVDEQRTQKLSLADGRI
ncbi:MAG TPA: dTMP kinase [Propionibacteriaceae bacterium]|nr:dTMP kinase [Propionibacteriaceae bacterium]